MIASSAANNRDSFEVTPQSEQEIRITRLFNAPRQLVFEVMTKPEHVKRWWGQLGEGYSVPVCEIDLRPGGAWRFVNRHPGGEAAFHGEYREITPPSRRASASPSGARRPAMTTLAPSATKTSAVRNPMPLVAPVITATLPSNRPIPAP